MQDRGTHRPTAPWTEQGYAMVALLVGLSIMAVTLSVALPTWRTMIQRENEAELVFRGEQYARAIGLYQRQYANAFPPSLDVLVEQKFLRKKFIDPITNAEFQVLFVGQPAPGQGGQQGQTAQPGTAGAGGAAAQLGRGGGAATPSGLAQNPLGGQGGIMGVTSKSAASSMREYKGRSKYNEWAFVAVQASTRAGGGAGGGQTPTGGVGGGAPGGGRGVTPGQRGAPGGRAGQGQPAPNGRFGGNGPGQPFGQPGGQPFGGQPQSPFGPAGRGR